MSGCPADEDLSALVDGALPAAQELEVHRHLEICVTCRRQVEGLKALKRTVGQAYDHEAAPPALRRIVEAKRRKSPKS
jgi:anti-sigma factor RsiW